MDDLARRIAELEDEARARMTDLRKMKEAIEDRDREIARLHQEVDEVRRNATEDKEDELAAARSALEGSRRELVRLRDELEQARELASPETGVELDGLRARLAERVRLDEQQRAAARELEARYLGQLEERDEEIATLRERYAAVQNDLREVRGRSGDAMRKAGLFEGEIDVLRQERDSLLERQTSQQRHVEAAEAELAERDRLLEQLRTEASALEERFRRHVSERDEQLAELQQRLQERTEQISGREERARRLEAQVDDLQASLLQEQTAHGRDIERATDLGEELARTRSLLEEERAIGSARLQDLQQDVERLASEIRGKDERVVQLRAEVDAIAAERDGLREELDALRASEERARRAAETEIERLRRRVESHASDVATAEARVRDLEAAAEEADVQLQEHLRATKAFELQAAERGQQLEAALGDRSRMERTIESLRSDLSDIETRMQRRLDERELTVERLEQTLKASGGELQEQRNRVERLTADLEAAHRRSEQRDTRIASLEEELRRLQAVRERLLRELHEQEDHTRREMRRAPWERSVDDDGDEGEDDES